jgi:hypothetical protein
MRMNNLPSWPLWITAATVGFSQWLAFVLVGSIGQFSHRALWMSSKPGPERVRDEAAIAIPLG